MGSFFSYKTPDAAGHYHMFGRDSGFVFRSRRMKCWLFSSKSLSDPLDSLRQEIQSRQKHDTIDFIKIFY